MNIGTVELDTSSLTRDASVVILPRLTFQGISVPKTFYLKFSDKKIYSWASTVYKNLCTMYAESAFETFVPQKFSVVSHPLSFYKIFTNSNRRLPVL